MKKEKKDKKKLLKNAAAVLALTFAVPAIVMTFEGCEVRQTPGPVNPDNGNQDNIDPNKPESEVGSMEYPRELTEKLLIGNYSCYVNDLDGSKLKKYEFEKDKVHIENTDFEIFYDYVDGIVYKYEYKSEDKKFHKTESELFKTHEIIYDDLNNTLWFDYDPVTSTYFGSGKNGTVTLSIENDGIRFKSDDKIVNLIDIGTTKINYPSKDDVVDETNKVAVPVEEVNELLVNLDKNNFVCNIIENGVVKKYSVDGTTVKIEDDELGRKYLFVENNKNFKLEYNKQENKWYKDYSTENIDTKTIIYNDLKNATWKSYDPDTQEFSGEINGKQVIMRITNDGFVIDGNGLNVEVSKINNNIVEFPSRDKIIDKTSLFIEENGERVYNMELLNETLTRWITKENKEGKDLLSVIGFSDKVALDKILFTNIKEDRIEFGLFEYQDQKKCYRLFKIDDIDLLKIINAGEVSTKYELLDQLKLLNAFDIKSAAPVKLVSYSTFDNGYDKEHKEEFEALTKQVFERMKNSGIQKENIDKFDVTTKKDFSNVKILSGFKTLNEYIGVGFGFGHYYNWRQCYIVENNDKYELLEFSINSSKTYNSNIIGNVINGQEGWVISNCSVYELDKGINSLYSEINSDYSKIESIDIEPTYTYITDDKEYLTVTKDEWDRLWEAEYKNTNQVAEDISK